MIILIEPNKNGKIELTKEQLQEYFEQAKEEGTKEERNRQINRITVNPCVPLSNPNNTGNPPINWGKYNFTCTPEQNAVLAKAQEFIGGESEIMATSQTQCVPTIRK